MTRETQYDDMMKEAVIFGIFDIYIIRVALIKKILPHQMSLRQTVF